MATSPDFLAIGHIARDVSPDGYRLGGTAASGALTALRLGLRPGIVTSFAPDLDTSPATLGMPLHVVPSAATTTFHNTYPQGKVLRSTDGGKTWLNEGSIHGDGPPPDGMAYRGPRISVVPGGLLVLTASRFEAMDGGLFDMDTEAVARQRDAALPFRGPGTHLVEPSDCPGGTPARKVHRERRRGPVAART